MEAFLKLVLLKIGLNKKRLEATESLGLIPNQEAVKKLRALMFSKNKMQAARIP